MKKLRKPSMNETDQSGIQAGIQLAKVVIEPTTRHHLVAIAARKNAGGKNPKSGWRN